MVTRRTADASTSTSATRAAPSASPTTANNFDDRPDKEAFFSIAESTF
jgi:hypothetical protein